MAFGFTPKFEQDLDLNGLDPKHYLAISLEAVKQFDWKVNYISRSGFIALIGGGIFSSMEELQVRIQEGRVFIVSKNLSNGMFDWGKNKSHVEEFIEAFENVQSNISEHDLDEKITELTPVFGSEEEDKLNAPPANFQQNLQTFISFFIPRKGYFITPIIININILVFVLMLLSGVSFFEPRSEDLIAWGANIRMLTIEGQWWRLITNIFLHIGILHLMFNMYALLYIGLLLEPYLGKIRFAAAYLFTGILASLTSIYWHPVTISAGASGAIFGMYGVFLAMLTTNFIDKSMRKQLLISIGVFVAFNLMNGMKQGIDNAAHIGGLVSGLIIGYAYYPSLKKSSEINFKLITVGLIAIMVVFTSFIIYHNIPPDEYSKYNKDMKEFANNEQIALSIFKISPKTPNNEVISDLNAGINNWQKNLLIINKMDQLDDLPPALFSRSAKLRQYCKLRIKSYNYLIKEVNENNRQYQSAIDSCNIQIKSIIDDLRSNN